jgi:hypothetical protein
VFKLGVEIALVGGEPDGFAEGFEVIDYLDAKGTKKEQANVVREGIP